MGKIAYERRTAVRHELRTRVRLYNEHTQSYEDAHLKDINASGMYLITRRKLSMDQIVEVVVPCEPDEDTIKLKGQVIRLGRHRSWGMFSYACRILH